MTTIESSYLAEIAKAEQLENEITQELADACRVRLVSARQQAQAELAELPVKIQEERRQRAHSAKEAATKQSVELQRTADTREQEIQNAANEMEAEIVQLVLSKILPAGLEVNP